MNHIIMIKKILYRFLPVCLLVAGFSGCKDDTMEPLPETAFDSGSKCKELCNGGEIDTYCKSE